MGFIDPMTAGDVTIRLQMDKNVSSNNNITIEAHIGLPDLKIGQYSLQQALRKFSEAAQFSD